MVGKSQIVDAIAARGSSRVAAAAAVDAVLAEITAALAAGERVTLTGFGTFDAVARAERTARNPRTGEAVTVAATTVARFHPGAALREAVASGDAGERGAVDLSGLETGPAPARARRAAPVPATPLAPVAAATKAAKAANAEKPEKSGKSDKSAKSEKAGKKADKAKAAPKGKSKGKKK